MTQQEIFLLELDFDIYSDTVLRIVVQNTINYHNAEDVVQEMFIRFAQNGEKFWDGRLRLAPYPQNATFRV